MDRAVCKKKLDRVCRSVGGPRLSRFLGGGAGMVEGEQLGENFVAGEGGGPAVVGEDGFIEGAVDVVESGHLSCCALVIEVGQGSLLELVFVRAWRVEPFVALADEFACRIGDGLHTRVRVFGWFGAGWPRKREGVETSLFDVARVTGDAMHRSVRQRPKFMYSRAQYSEYVV